MTQLTSLEQIRIAEFCADLSMAAQLSRAPTSMPLEVGFYLGSAHSTLVRSIVRCDTALFLRGQLLWRSVTAAVRLAHEARS